MPTGQYQTAMKPKATCQKEFQPSVKRGRAIPSRFFSKKRILEALPLESNLRNLILSGTISC